MLSTISYPMSSMSVEERDSSCGFGIEQEITHELEQVLIAKTQKQPILILIGGFQGSGKSSLIARIKKIYDINVISTDAIRQSLFNRGIKVSPQFSEHVNNIYKKLIRKSLSNNSNILIDANAHSKRIEEIDKLLKENDSHYSMIKIFSNASEKTLRDRLRTRKSTMNCYQGTESDLEAALSSTKINLQDYNLTIDTDKHSESSVFDLVNDYISPYFNLQNSVQQ